MISQAAARLLRALGLLLKKKRPARPRVSSLATLDRPAPPPPPPRRCDRGYTSPYPTPVATHDPPTYRR